MHAVMRRMPAEQARHAKRLGHVQGSKPVLPIIVGSNSASSTTTTATTTQQSVTSVTTTSSESSHVVTSTSQSSSSAPPSSSITQSLTSSPSSATPTLTSTTPGPLPLTTDAASSTTSIPPSASPSPQTRTAAGGLSSGAMAGIIAGGVIVGVALIMFFIRKTYLRRRERKRISWTGAPGLGAGTFDEPKLFPDVNERPTLPTIENTRPGSAPVSPFDPRGQSMYSAPVSPGVNVQVPTFPTYAIPTPPSATYNNPAVVAYPTPYGLGNSATPPMARASRGIGASSNLLPMQPHHAPMEAVVVCSFVPSLPDELSITTGERVFVIEQYDDGWNLCSNGRGERGMVPRECLDSTPPDPLDMGWRNANRMSSLSSDGRRY